MKTLKQYLNEDFSSAPTNSAGGGAVAGIGIGKDGEPGIRKFAGSRVFKVPTKSFVQARMLKRKYARFESYLGDPDIARQISEYANKNYNEAIIIEDEQTGAMQYIRYGKGN